MGKKVRLSARYIFFKSLSMRILQESVCGNGEHFTRVYEGVPKGEKEIKTSS